MANSEKSKCKYCFECKEGGRQRSQGGRLGRKTYYCKNPDAKKLPLREFGNRAPYFIGFGDMTCQSPLTTKTSPRWCPRNKQDVTRGGGLDGSDS